MSNEMRNRADPDNLVVSGANEVIKFLQANTTTEAVWRKIQDFITGSLTELRNDGIKDWPYILNLKGPSYSTTHDGTDLRVYMLEAFAGPKLSNSATEAEAQTAAKQIRYFQCYLELNEDDEIVAYIQAVKAH